MKATGIVRRTDDLGRIVIPKEVRRVAGIEVGDPLEIFCSPGEVVLKKYVSETENEKIISELLNYVMNNTHWCPFTDEAQIDFEKECVGFGEIGCRECILRNINQLNFEL